MNHISKNQEEQEEIVKQHIHLFLYDNIDILILTNLNDRFPSKVDLQNTYQKICDYLQIAVNTLPDEEFNLTLKIFVQKYKLDIKKHIIQ